MVRAGKIALTLVCAFPLTGCAFLAAHPQARGNRVDPAELTELVPGVSTKKDAASLLGSPTAHGSFDDNKWIYIGAMTRPVIGGTQHLISEDNVVLTFDARGVLRDVRATHLRNALPHTMLARTTPSPGSNTSFLQQLLGNVGKVNTLSQGPTNNVGTAAQSDQSNRFTTGM